jgi:hypothetical protein
MEPNDEFQATIRQQHAEAFGLAAAKARSEGTVMKSGIPKPGIQASPYGRFFHQENAR